MVDFPPPFPPVTSLLQFGGSGVLQVLKGHNLLNSLVTKAEHLAGSVLVGVKMHPARFEALGRILHLQQTLTQHERLGRSLKPHFQNIHPALDGSFSSTPHSTNTTLASTRIPSLDLSHHIMLPIYATCTFLPWKCSVLKLVSLLQRCKACSEDREKRERGAGSSG